MTTTKPQAERLTLTVAEAAEALGIGLSLAYEAVNQGAIPCVRVGRRFLIPRAALEKMLAGAGEGGNAAA